MKCTGYLMKNHNEMHWVSNEKPQWNALGIQWKITVKYPGIHIKIAMKCTGYVMQGTMYLLKNHHWDGLTDLWNAYKEFLIFYEKSQAI